MIGALSRRTSICVPLGVRAFHASDAPQEKHRNIPKRSFYHPRHRFWSNLENLYNNGFETQPTSQFVLKYMRHLNHPLGDIYLKQTKPEIRLPSDFLKSVYYRRFPKDRFIYLHRNNPEDREWYKLPVDRFVERAEKYVAKGMPQGAAIAQAFKDKRIDKEAVQIEFQVCKQQSEVLFGVQETNWGELIEQGHATENIMTYDPRANEAVIRDAHAHVRNLIAQREADPRRPTLKLKDLRMRWIDVINYIQSHPESRDHFDETVYFDNPDEFATSLPASLRKELKDPKPGENTMLDDLNFQMTQWAGDMLQSFKSEIDESKVPEEQRDEAIREKIISKIEKETKVVMTDELAESMNRANFAISPSSFTRDQFDTSADEVLSKPAPVLDSDLRKEMDSLFADLQKSSTPPSSAKK
jgi:hypothetical protein